MLVCYIPGFQSVGPTEKQTKHSVCSSDIYMSFLGMGGKSKIQDFQLMEMSGGHASSEPSLGELVSVETVPNTRVKNEW